MAVGIALAGCGGNGGGGRGESCNARNDCASGLACINHVCSQNDFNLSVDAKSCDIVECQTTMDCCANYHGPAPCPLTCDNMNRCITMQTCMMDSDCFVVGLAKCNMGTCVECVADMDCHNANAKCVANKCNNGCTHNEECALFQSCQNGACMDTGCTSDRECYFATTNPLAKCANMKCTVPCENDAECGDFQACQSGNCVFVGCMTDEECRVYLKLTNDTSGRKAVCR
jgi:hypothetical protein